MRINLVWRTVPALVASILLTLFVIQTAVAQSTASINGTVNDGSGAAVPGAELILTNVATGQTRQAFASGEGYFNFTELGSGSYRLRISASGFKETVLDSLALTVGQQLTVRPALQIGALSETVEVQGTPPPVTTSTASVGQLVDSKRIEQLPLNGRNALQLVALVPGVVESGTVGQYGATQVSFRSSGGRAASMNYSLDGAINMNHFYDSASDYPNPDALQEFQVSTRTLSAAFGRGSASVSAVTKSGTNGFHGSAFEFLRNTDLDARQFFAKAPSEFKRNQFGATLGGPIVRDKAFFFVAYQGTKQRGSPGETRYLTMTAAQRAGDFSAQTAPLRDPDSPGTFFPGNRIPASRIRPFADNFINGFLPEANSGTDFFSFTPDYKLDQNQVITRVDYTITQKDRVMVRYLFNDIPQRGSASGNPLDRGWLAELPTRSQSATVSYMRLFSTAFINDFRLSYLRNAWGTRLGKVLSLSDLGLAVNDANSVTAYGMVPQSSIAVSGFFTANPGLSVRDVIPTTHLADTASWVRGKHSIQFGGEIYKNRVNQIANWYTQGAITFNGAASGNSAADMLLGRFSAYRQITPTITRLHQTLPSLFFQDDIRLSRNLTLNLGLRWEPSMAWTSEDKELSTFQPGIRSTLFPNMAPGLLYPGDNDLPESIVGNRLSNIAPRAGIAWDVRGDGKTAIRVSYGTYFMPFTRSISLNRFAYIQPFALDVTISGGDTNNIFAQAPFNGVNPYPRPNLSDQQGLKEVQFVAAANHTAYELPWKTAADQQWSFSIQQALGAQSSLEVNYIGSASSHLYTSAEGNPATYFPGQSTLANTQQRRRYPQFGALNVNKNAISSNYNSLQVSFNRRYSRGVSVLSSYTWSKALGVVAAEGEGSSGPRNPDNYRLQYGPHGFDIRHNLVTSFLWQLPFGQNASSRLVRHAIGGWQLNGIAKIRSGLPFTVSSGRDNSLRGISGDTGDQIADWQLPDDRSKQDRMMKWFNTAAFVQNAIGTYGTTGINSLRGPGFWNLDLSVNKVFILTEGNELQFRASLFNSLNHANPSNPSGSLTSSSFGRITSVSEPRIIEFGLRLSF